MKSIRIFITAVLAAATVGLPVLLPASVSAQASFENSKNAACTGIEDAGDDVCGNGGLTIDRIITAAVNILTIVVGIAAVIMVIVGGFRYVTSGGDSAAVNSAKNTVLYALVGVVVVALAQVFVRFVLGKLT